MTTLKNHRLDFSKLLQLDDLTVLGNVFSSPNGIQEFLGVSEELLDLYNKAAESLLKEKRWKDAADAYKFLLFLNQFRHNHLIGAGIAEQSQGHFEEALKFYVLAEITDPTDPTLYANACQCAFALGEPETAKIFMQQCLECCENHPEYADIKVKLEEFSKKF